jgi:hypothetical protein
MPRASHNRVRNCAAWVAIVAMALNALWPLLAHLQPGPAPALAQLRTEMAMHHGEHHGHHGAHHGGADDDSAPAEPSPLTPHCSFCSLAAGFASLAAHPVSPMVLATGGEFRPALPEIRPLALFRYSPASPRAPPALS